MITHLGVCTSQLGMMALTLTLVIHTTFVHGTMFRFLVLWVYIHCITIVWEKGSRIRIMPAQGCENRLFLEIWWRPAVAEGVEFAFMSFVPINDGGRSNPSAKRFGPSSSNASHYRCCSSRYVQITIFKSRNTYFWQLRHLTAICHYDPPLIWNRLKSLLIKWPWSSSWIEWSTANNTVKCASPATRWAFPGV